MTYRSILIATALVTTGLSFPFSVQAAGASATCSVAVDYVFNGAVTEEYRKDFVVEQGVTFVDDFSTTTRAKTFSATLGREAGKLAITMDYFNDVGVFHAIGLNTKLVLHTAKGFESTSGSQGMYISNGVTPSSVGGNHETNYTLTCRRS